MTYEKNIYLFNNIRESLHSTGPFLSVTFMSKCKETVFNDIRNEIIFAFTV